MNNQCLCDTTFTCSVCQDKKRLKAVVLALVLGMSSAIAHGAATEAVFTKNISAPMQADQAILASASGETVWKCQRAEYKISKSGTSVSMRTRKKQLSAEEAQAKIDEINKQRDQK